MRWSAKAEMPFVPHNMTTTQFELHGYEVVQTLGMVRGIIVRSRSIFGTIGASLQTLVGGNITILTDLCEKTRQEALDLMLQHAGQLGANAVVGVRYDATDWPVPGTQWTPLALDQFELNKAVSGSGRFHC